MRTKTFQLMLTGLLGLTLATPVLAQNQGTFTVDGDPVDWGGLRYDLRQDVVPDTNRAVDLNGYGLGAAQVFLASPDTLVTFLFHFLAPPFQGAEETTVEIFFDMSVSDSYGEAQPPWTDFRPDYVIGVTGSNGALTKEFYWRYTGSGWDKKEGADIPELDMAFATKYLEGAWDWKLLDIPDTELPYYEVESYNQLKAVRISKGAFRDYAPNGDHPWREQILPRHRPDFWTQVESDTWGGIKSR